MNRAAALALAGLLTAPLPALAAAEAAAVASPAAPLDAAAARIATGAAKAAETGTALEAATAQPQQVAALGKAIQAYEAALAEIRAGVGDADVRVTALSQDLADHRSEIARLLATLEAMSRTPPPAEALHPQGPIAAAQATAMMQRLTPALRTRAEALRDQLAALTAARDVQTRGEAAVTAALPRLNAARGALTRTLASSAPQELGPADPAATSMARDSASLTALAAALAKTAATTPAPAAADPADPTPYVWPVRGTVEQHYDDPDAAGVRRPGITLSAAALSLVSAPADAVVRYAGPFLEYGYVLVLAPDSATMIVLAGFDRLQVQTGATVRKGELLGLLGGSGAEADEYVNSADADSGTGVGETLYIEVRHGQGPVDPEPLFAGEDG